MVGLSRGQCQQIVGVAKVVAATAMGDARVAIHVLSLER